jgi:4-hydroxybenzoate polyprenyltransferase
LPHGKERTHKTNLLLMAWLRLIRWQNLLIIALTQLLVWWCVVLPEKPVSLASFNFSLLSLSTVLIAAAGYIINDYFDIKIDQINHPEKVVLGKVIPRKTAIIAHTFINITALALAAVVAVSARHPEWLLIQLGCTGLLWLYSTTYKRQYLTGNISIAVLTSLTVLVLYVYEPALRHPANPLPVAILLVYAFFAFMLTWIREIVKDMEDLKGDEAEGCITMPIKHGLAYAARFASVLAVVAIVPLAVSAAALFSVGYVLLSSYVLGLLVIPLAVWIWFLWQGAASSAHYHRASRMLKIIMVLGVCSLLIYKLG